MYLAFACAIAWPVPIHPQATVLGPIGADLTGEIDYYHALAVAGTPPFLPGTTHSFNAPEGRPTQWAVNFSTLPSSLLLWLGSVAFGAVATFGYWAILAFTLSALSMFLLVRWLTDNWEAAFIAGLAFGFWPYVYSSMNQPLGHEWVLVLFVWRMLVAIERPTARNGLLAGAAAAFAMWWVQYFILIVGVTWVVLAACAIVLGGLRHQLVTAIRTQAVVAVPVAGALSAIAVAGLATRFANVPLRASSDLVRYSARPLMYLLPDPSNPILGPLSKPVIQRHFFSSTSTAAYNNIYLGISVLALALVSAVVSVRAVRRAGLSRALEQRRIPAAIVLLVAALVALVFSAPPQVSIFGTQVPTPMDLVSHVTTVFRTTARFAVIVMLGLSVLVGVGLAYLLPRFSRRSAILITAGLAIVVGGDLWARSSPSYTHIRVPAIYGVLAREPAGVYAEYPLLSGSDFGGDSGKGFYQAWAGRHTLFDGYFAGSESESRKMELQQLDTRTIPDLAGLGVRYLLVDTLSNGPGRPPHYPMPGAPITGADLIAVDRFHSLYRITAQPPALNSFATDGFSLPEGSGPAFIRWMVSTSGEVEIRSATATPMPARISFTVASFAQPRQLEIRDDRGRILFRGSVSTGYSRVTFDATVMRRTVLHFHATPAPQSPHTLDPKNPDTRTLAIQIEEPFDIRMSTRPAA